VSVKQLMATLMQEYDEAVKKMKAALKPA